MSVWGRRSTTNRMLCWHLVAWKAKFCNIFSSFKICWSQPLSDVLELVWACPIKDVNYFYKNAQEGECFENGEMSMGDRIFTCSGRWYYFLRWILVSQKEFLIYRWLPEGINAIWSKIPYSFRYSLMSALSNYNYYVFWHQ